ncbi:MAG: ABC transporter ATP-binding protein [Deltaproteobacteria bacterium]|nr:MAG: ABC transporter ATP-binding protein [Deltaproteobacteria bacterium]
MDNPEVIIRLQGVSFTYPGNPSKRPVLNDLNLQLSRGERVGLVGPNGSGKTTLFHLIVGLLTPTQGEIEVLGKKRREERDFKEVREKVGLLFQDADDQLFCPTVAEDVAFGPLNLGKTREESMAIVREVLSTLGLQGFEDRLTYKLSGGEKRLVSLATVLAMQPEVLIMDEPSTGLDEDTLERLVHILTNSDLSYIIASHNGDFLTRTTDVVYRLGQGRLSRTAFSTYPNPLTQGHYR